MVSKTVKWVIGGAAALYLLNLTFGFVEILPDNMALIGNIDEGVAAVIADEFLLGGAIRKLLSKQT